ncbi:neither inactivation nor afterpotential protein G-like [Ostrinia furnacalis]|uniref:neither inactivation nor afterpotential protein G-like n=1 Tax=Ostrinia furnacalis TaxID=93504 RepID=UPI0010405BCE|nr:neither inactivation nor afterpotential protein G-like [Ostrinia furnacalis]
MGVYSYLLGVIVAFISYLMYQRYAHEYSSIIQKPEKRYDYIIVGAGTAGCVLAARLSEDPRVSVLLVEAGDHMGYFTKIPLTPTAAQQGPNDWSVRTTPQKYSSFGLWGQTQILPRGKGLGGSGQINFLLHGFGFPEEYQRWARLGFRGWTAEDLKPYFIKAFGTVQSEFDSNHCSVDGVCPGDKAPMKLKMLDDSDELLTTYKQASTSLKDKYTVFRKPVATVRDGIRHMSWDAYLKPVLRRRNLHLLRKTQAVSVRFENKKASSLYILQDHRNLDNIFVNREIILSAGAIKTPQIMMLSGVGPRELIQRLKIQLIAENEHVGRNFHDNMNMPIFVSIRKPISVTLAKVFAFSTVWNYYWMNSGLLSFPPVAGIELRNSSALLLFSMGTASERLLRDLSNYKTKVFRSTFPFYNDTSKEGFMFLSTCIQPKSRGTVFVKDPSTYVPPVVDPNYLHRIEDIRCMIKAIRRAEQLVATKAFQEIGARIHWPRPERCLSFWNYSKEEQMGPDLRRKRKFKSSPEIKPKQIASAGSPPDEYLECVIREVAVTGHHAAGTCAGGAVVDEELRVKSVSGLRILDASVFPSPVSFYPNSVLIAMAERAADLIKKSY